MNRSSLLILLILFVIIPLSAGAQDAVQATPAPTPAAQQAKSVSTNPVVARVENLAITERDVMGAIDQMAAQRQLAPEQEQEKYTVLFNDAIESLVGMALLRAEGKSQGIVIEKDKVDTSFKALADKFPSKEEFDQALAKQGLDESTLRMKLEDNMMVQSVIDQMVKDTPPPMDDQVKKFYDDNPQFFEVSEQVHASHLFLSVDNSATAEQKAAIKTKLEGIRAEIESKKIGFAEAAAKYSDDKSTSQTGGDLGLFSRGEMIAPLEDACFATKPGEISQVVETPFGYHLINVLENRAAGKKPLEEAKVDIKSYLEGKSKQELVLKHIDDLKTKIKVDSVMSAEEWSKRHGTN
jgi:peptidyl-prolyl cis-trans isomerase C